MSDRSGSDQAITHLGRIDVSVGERHGFVLTIHDRPADAANNRRVDVMAHRHLCREDFHILSASRAIDVADHGLGMFVQVCLGRGRDASDGCSEMVDVEDSFEVVQRRRGGEEGYDG